MQADSKVVLDACVLANIAVCDLFLRLAEKPRLLVPKWSSQTLEETRRTQAVKLNWPPHLVESWRRAVEQTFPDSTVDDDEDLIQRLTNHPKDRHVLAAAIRSRASDIVTFNLKDFPRRSLEPFGIKAFHPQDYLLTRYFIAPEIMTCKLRQMARKRDLGLINLLRLLGKALPAMTLHLIQDLGLEH